MSKLYPGNSYVETLQFKDGSDQLFDPASVTVEFLMPSRVVAATLVLGDLEHTAEGVYELKWNLPVDAEKGTWTRKISFTIEGFVKTSEEPFNVSTQPYGTLSVVKRLCNLSDSDAQDSVLMGYLDDSTDWINPVLMRHGVTVPLDPVPPEVARIASYFAAGMFLQRDIVEGKRHPYVEDAKEALEAYVGAVYLRDPPLIVTRKHCSSKWGYL